MTEQVRRIAALESLELAKLEPDLAPMLDDEGIGCSMKPYGRMVVSRDE